MSDSNKPEVTQASTPAERATPDPGGGDPAVIDADEAYCAACNQSFTIDAKYCPNDGAKLVKLKAKRDALIGRTLEGRYEIRGALGHGGMGTVYRGWQLSVDREVAIKVIHPKYASERAVAKRFFREARLASRLSQANIIAVYEFGQDEDILYLVMELLRGRPLSKDLESGRPLPIKRIKRIGMQICDGLDAAHSQGIVHRDLKPGNIVILDDPPGRDHLKILDFGLAKSLVHENTSLVTKTDAILGTPLYMPPEQILGKPSDHTADLYSLGCILYQLAMGRPPYIGDNINVVLGAHVREPVPPFADHVHGQLAEIITQLMDKTPSARIQSARAVHEMLGAIIDDASTIGSVAALDRKYLTPRPGSQSGADLAKAQTLTSSPAHSPVTSPSRDQPPRRRWLLPVFGLLLAGAIGFIIYRSVSRSGVNGTAPLVIDSDMGGESSPVYSDVPQQDIAEAKDTGDPVDAALDAVQKPIDARKKPLVDARRQPIDAAPAVIPDAKVEPRASDAQVVPDAASKPVDAKKPDLDIIRPDAKP